MKVTLATVAALSLLVESFLSPVARSRSRIEEISWRPLFGARYGPPMDEEIDEQEYEQIEKERVERQGREFRKLVEQVMTTADPSHLPGLMTRHVELLLSMNGYEGNELIEKILQETEGHDQTQQQVVAAIDYILNFAEDFVEQTTSMDNSYKTLLGRIIRQMVDKGEDEDGEATALDREELLNELMEKEKPNFTAGFLRHIENECARIENAPSMTRESSRLLETMRIIQTRVLEEVGKDLGEGALVLGQLLGYTDRNERLGVLDAGLTVRGLTFAQELRELTKEALDGFQRVPGGADPELVTLVTEIDERIEQFIEGQNVMQ